CAREVGEKFDTW
nr:immunoglobulin heavy chain junction region [Macaca mulatta]MOX01403.1 immunoglobulin heavy chain junction region [Macaca mulatta]MOX01505.1 immunoglobulin heavy chain junction region [Macaca mulatta]